VVTSPDWPVIEREYRAGQLSVKELGRQYKLSDAVIHKRAKAHGWTRDLGPFSAPEAPDWPVIEREYRAGQLSVKELGRQYKLSDAVIRKRAKAYGWTRDLSGARCGTGFARA
jgi:hypothetical protein